MHDSGFGEGGWDVIRRETKGLTAGPLAKIPSSLNLVGFAIELALKRNDLHRKGYITNQFFSANKHPSHISIPLNQNGTMAKDG